MTTLSVNNFNRAVIFSTDALQGRAFSNVASLMKFAEDSVAALKRECPSCLSCFLMRVDIMQRRNGRMIVNEFESFEAGCSGSGDSEAIVRTWLSNFWKDILHD